MPSGNISTLTLTVVASGAVSAERFVTQSGGYPTAGGVAFGVGMVGQQAVDLEEEFFADGDEVGLRDIV